MASEIVTLADALVVAMNESTLVPDAQAERRWLPYSVNDKNQLKDLQTLKVVVVPKSATQVPDCRGEWLFEYTVDIGLQQKLTSNDNDRLDYLSEIVEAICDKWLAALGTYRVNNSVLIRVEPTLWDPTLLREFQVFTGLVSLTFQKYRTIE